MTNKIAHSELRLNKQNNLLNFVYALFWNLFDATVFDSERQDFPIESYFVNSSSCFTNYTYDYFQPISMNTSFKSVVMYRTDMVILPVGYKCIKRDYNYFGARYYMSDLSIWLSVDPLASMFPNMSPYAYVFNNPINLIDRFGLAPEGDDDPPKGSNPDLYEQNTPNGQGYRGNGNYKHNETGETSSDNNTRTSGGQSSTPQTSSASARKFKFLPLFLKLDNYYLAYGIDYSGGGISDSQFGNIVGGKVKSNIDAGTFSNTCALRVSHTLNMNGDKIPYIKNLTSSGANGDKYIFRVLVLESYMRRTYGPPTIVSKDLKDFIGHKGIIIFDTRGLWGDASGHSTLFDGNNRLGGNYKLDFYFKNSNKVMLWEAK